MVLGSNVGPQVGVLPFRQAAHAPPSEFPGSWGGGDEVLLQVATPVITASTVITWAFVSRRVMIVTPA